MLLLRVVPRIVILIMYLMTAEINIINRTNNVLKMPLNLTKQRTSKQKIN